MMKSRSKKSLLLALAIGLASSLGVSDADAIHNPILQGLMKRINQYSSGGNMAATSRLLVMVTSMGPEEYKEWAPIAEKARAAAARGDSVSMKAACNNCHDQYREQYKAKYSGSKPGPVPVPVPGQ